MDAALGNLARVRFAARAPAAEDADDVRVYGLTGPSQVERQVSVGKFDEQIFIGAHDGYYQNTRLIHERRLILAPDGGTVYGLDVLRRSPARTAANSLGANAGTVPSGLQELYDYARESGVTAQTVGQSARLPERLAARLADGGANDTAPGGAGAGSEVKTGATTGAGATTPANAGAADSAGPGPSGGRAANGPRFAIHFHLHPDIAIARTTEPGCVQLTLPDGVRYLFRSGAERAVLSIEESVFLAARTGPFQTLQIVLRGTMNAPEDRDFVVEWRLEKKLAVEHNPYRTQRVTPQVRGGDVRDDEPDGGDWPA